MFDWLVAGHAPWFSIPALLGTGFLLIELVLGQIGDAGGLGEGGTDLASGDLASTDAPGGDAGTAHKPGHEATWLSLQSVAAFAVGFGWIGLGAYTLMDLSFLGSAALALLAGVGLAWLSVVLTRSLLRLQSDANVVPADAVGREGTVCVLVPAAGAGSGRVTMVVRQMQQEFNAVQEGDEPIPSRTPVRVLRADASTGTITVARA